MQRTKRTSRCKSGAWMALFALALACVPGGRVRAASPPGYELWIGVLAHDAPILGGRKEHGPDLNLELVFPSPVPASSVAGVAPVFRWLLRPRPDVGGTLNTAGDTSQLYLGLTWTTDLGRDVWRAGDAVFFDVSVGPGFNNGEVATTDPNRKSLGSHVLFHSSIQLGYRLDRTMSVALYLEHASDAGITRENEGLTNLGVRLGIGF